MFNNKIFTYHFTQKKTNNKNKWKDNLLYENPKSNFTIWTSAESEDLCTIIIKAGTIMDTEEKERTGL